MDAMIFLGFVLTVVIGVALLALMLKFLDLHEQVAAREDKGRIPEAVSPARTIAAKMPAFFRIPHASQVAPAKLRFNDRLPMLHEIDHRHVLWALDQAGGNHAHAAGLLGTTESAFDLLVTEHCGSSLKTGRGAEVPRQEPEPWAAAAGSRDAIDDRLFAFVQNRIWAEQAVASAFVHLPSIDSLYRQARPTLTMR